MNLGENLRLYRKRANLTQQEVAAELHISRQAISQWEQGRCYPDLDNLVLLSHLYHVDYQELLSDNPDAKKAIMQQEDAMSSENVKPIPKKAKADGDTNKDTSKTVDGHTKYIVDKGLLLLIFSTLLFVLAPLGVGGAPVIIWQNKKTNRFHRLIYVVAIICLLYNLLALGIDIANWFNFGVTSYY